MKKLFIEGMLKRTIWKKIGVLDSKAITIEVISIDVVFSLIILSEVIAS